jgi:hypothetical protein
MVRLIYECCVKKFWVLSNLRHGSIAQYFSSTCVMRKVFGRILSVWERFTWLLQSSRWECVWRIQCFVTTWSVIWIYFFYKMVVKSSHGLPIWINVSWLMWSTSEITPSSLLYAWINVGFSEWIYVKFDIGDIFVDTFRFFDKTWQN